MLKKYKNSGKPLSKKQMMLLNGGTTNELQMPPQCFTASDCGHTVCDTPEYTLWICQNKRCILLYC